MCIVYLLLLDFVLAVVTYMYISYLHICIYCLRAIDTLTYNIACVTIVADTNNSQLN